MNKKFFIVAISMAFVSTAHAQATPHVKAAPQAGKNASVSQPVAPTPSTNTLRTINQPPVRGNGAKTCLQGSGPQDNPTGIPCRHVKTTQI